MASNDRLSQYLTGIEMEESGHGLISTHKNAVIVRHSSTLHDT